METLKEKVVKSYESHKSDGDIFAIRRGVAGDWFEGLFRGYDLSETLRIFDDLYWK